MVQTGGQSASEPSRAAVHRSRARRNSRLKVHFTTIDNVEHDRSRSGKSYREFLRVPAMSGGLYVLPVGGTDLQRPHHEDEMYYVIRGRARFRAGYDHREVSPGSVIFVAAEVEHRFYDIAEELTVLVFFAPAES